MRDLSLDRFSQPLQEERLTCESCGRRRHVEEMIGCVCRWCFALTPEDTREPDLSEQ